MCEENLLLKAQQGTNIVSGSRRSCTSTATTVAHLQKEDPDSVYDYEERQRRPPLVGMGCCLVKPILYTGRGALVELAGRYWILRAFLGSICVHDRAPRQPSCVAAS